ncbi:vomeronasal type-2 receptor 26-like [Rhinophrynus dorsalis]
MPGSLPGNQAKRGLLSPWIMFRNHFPVLSVLYASTLLLVTQTSRAQNESNIPYGCKLSDQSGGKGGYRQEGDLILGILIQLFYFKSSTLENFRQPPGKMASCFRYSLQYYRHYLAAIFAIEEINKNPNILPNVTLGFHIYDTCSNEREALANTLSILTERMESVPNYKCNQKGSMTAFVGHLLSSVSRVVYLLTGIYRFPQISYGAQDASFSDRLSFPTFYRTMTNENTQYEAIVQLLKKFNWTWVGIVATDDESHKRSSEELKNEILKSGVACIDFLAFINEKAKTSILFAKEKIKQSTANVVIINTTAVLFLELLYGIQMVFFRNKVWIATSTSSSTRVSHRLHSFNGSLLVASYQGDIPGLKDFFYKAGPARFPNDYITATLWKETFNCHSGKDSFYSRYNLCNFNDTLEKYESLIYNFNIYRLTYNMYTAVYALGHALNDMYSEKMKANSLVGSSRPQVTVTPWQLNSYLKKVHFKTTSGDEIFLNEYGEPPGRLDILSWNVFPNGTVTNRKVGIFDSSVAPGKQLIINKEILWAPQFNEIPQSTCSKSCPPGSRKILKKGMQICCYHCAPCSDGEISTMHDMENCVRCPKHQWSNEKRDKCIMRKLDFLSYEDPLGLALACIAIFLSSLTTAVLYIFIKYRKTPIVKANNQELSYFLLFSLILSFLCSLLFIGWPMRVTCLLRQVVFGVIFTFCISSVLGKTLTVVIAFNATRPGSMLRNGVGTRIPKCFVLFCSLLEVFICAFWLIHSPPFPDYDTESQTTVMVLLCNEGSAVAFYFVVGYIAILACVSFFVAYLARRLPDIFNEAQNITFSMLVFCSVWIAFIPAYLSTNGKYVTAVEIFAILASSAGLVGFIFFPKCYIIFFKPQMNIRES